MKNENIISLFIIEDSVIYATALKQFLETKFEMTGYKTSIHNFITAESCLELLNNNSNLKPDIVVLDYFLNSRFSDAMNGLNALFHFKVLNPGIEVIFLSSQNQMEVTVESLRTGAFDYVVKDMFAFQNIFDSIQQCLLKMKANKGKLPDMNGKKVSL